MAFRPPNTQCAMEPDDRLNLESALAEWREKCPFDADVTAELEEHLREAFAAGMVNGMSPGAAFREAVAQLGAPAQLMSEFSKLRHPPCCKTMKSSILKSARLRRIARNALLVAAISIPLRAFALTPYRAVGASVAPEIPAGSRVLAWRIAPTFAPGDIAVYQDGERTFLGRIVAVRETELVLIRNNQPEKTVARESIVGRVILTTR